VRAAIRGGSSISNQAFCTREFHAKYIGPQERTNPPQQKNKGKMGGGKIILAFVPRKDIRTAFFWKEKQKKKQKQKHRRVSVAFVFLEIGAIQVYKVSGDLPLL
jgi:hypothetical protein